MTAKTYKLATIADLLTVPGERRQDCVREILYLLALTELAGTQEVMAEGLLWTDDGDKTVAIHDTTGKQFLKLSIKKKVAP